MSTFVYPSAGISGIAGDIMKFGINGWLGGIPRAFRISSPISSSLLLDS
jgi:hypothetical protein